MKNILVGLTYAALWASASVATKIGLKSADPLLLANLRFFIAGPILLLASYALNKKKEYRLPKGKEWKHLSIFGLLNTTLYLGIYVLSMQFADAGIGSLTTSLGPLFITVMAATLLGRKVATSEIFGLILGISGVFLASYPLIHGGQTSFTGLGLLILSMLVVSYASIYYSRIKWELPGVLINGWQVLLGGIFLFPFTLLFADFHQVIVDQNLIVSVAWLSLAVSIVGLICWFYLLNIDPVRASFWQFLCPIFGFAFAWYLVDEPITIFTVSGTIMVILGLILSRRKPSTR